ncbi:hypothetical protein HanRHA438_Chr08g0348101 [Helianthus annuus]|uniref:Uncharacterized protein n=1 Tax=Helianthus annuus TaxID=4232 RepID=A0A9K3IEE7_HELAN|nr:hypothetical protein HanXRQr2_Chr08g0336651 [Helianthus annuus]KAJ0553351.1 hypothetical protein HanHA89_Chr08g0295431 [Helianthus annuus]KAJ0722259.1 hypothetical protein HanOQP8_Chr08g0284641 [Helianthus annuus]KAJ0897658.1 hypothetical protein HanRHA438_Chr08g0348101 [Helianthus annuus]
MHYRAESEGVPRVNVSIPFTEQDWYTTLTRKVTPIVQLEERALVAAGMSMLWALQNPRGFPVYGYRGKGIAFPVGAAEQVEARKKKREDKTEEKKNEEPVAETPRRRPSNSSFFDYVVVSDTLSCVDARVKRPSRDPDDDSTLTEMMKKRKMLEDKKKELDAQAAAALAEKKIQVTEGDYCRTIRVRD